MLVNMQLIVEIIVKNHKAGRNTYTNDKQKEENL